MGKRKGVKASINMKKREDGNGETSTSLSSMKRTRGQPLTTDKKIGGGGNSSKKMKRGEASNSCVKMETASGQTQESIVEETTILDLPPENANGELSTASLYWTRSRKEAPYTEIGDLELAIKRIKETNGQDEEGPINDLPPEMLTQILKFVDSLSLLKCRRVSRQWLEISSGILSTRTDIRVSFTDREGKRAPPEKKNNSRLHEFVELMKKCSNFPSARFSFDFEEPSFFNTKDWKGFLSLFAPSNPKWKPNQIQNQRTEIKYFYLKCRLIDNTTQLFTERLSDLLLNKIPRLEELGLDFESYSEVKENIKLFPLPKTPESKTDTVSASVPVPVQLPYLKVLQIRREMFVNFPGIVEDLLVAAVNLTTIHVKPPYWNKRIVQFLHSLGKLHLLQKLKIHLDEELSAKDFLSDMKNSTKHSDFLRALKLRELTLNVFARETNPTFCADATSFISNLLESCKGTLEKLEMTPLGFLHGLQFPKFTKLGTLAVFQYDIDENMLEQPFFPPGIRSRSREIFPVVDDLNFLMEDWETAFPQEDSIPIFSSVEDYYFNDYELEENVINKLVLMCPNLKHCTIQTREGNPEQFNFPRVGREIWTHLPQLESLEVDVDVNLESHAFPALDSCFTGISTENCQQLSDLMKAEKAKNFRKSLVKLPESEELTTLTQREHPSILDMKNLKKLTINPHSRKRGNHEKTFFSTKITWISEEFAFKLMPHFEFNGRRPSTSL